MFSPLSFFRVVREDRQPIAIGHNPITHINVAIQFEIVVVSITDELKGPTWIFNVNNTILRIKMDHYLLSREFHLARLVLVLPQTFEYSNVLRVVDPILGIS